MRDLITFANFNASQCKQTHVRVGKMVKRPEDPLRRICEGHRPTPVCLTVYGLSMMLSTKS